MRIPFTNNPIDRLSCIVYNTIENISRVFWIMGKTKTIECKICGKILNSRKDTYSPMQYGWEKTSQHTWICHQCLCYRDFKKYINLIDGLDE